MKNIFNLIFLAIFVPLSVSPHQALAFEATLPQAASHEFIAQVILKDRDSDLLITYQGLPTGSYTASAVAARPSVATKMGHWPKPTPTRLAAYSYVSSPLPSLDSPLVLTGEASYYSRAGCLGCDPNVIMANGQPLNDNALTIAIPAPLVKHVGRKAKVTSLATGKSVDVLITDTGGFYQAKYGHRVADLTIATKQAIGMAGGVGQVKVEVY